MTFLLIIHGLIALALVGVILLQKSEGGGLTGGGSAGGLVSARGAADLLTRTTAILASLFLISSLGLAWLAGHSNRPQTIDTSLARESAPTGPLGPAPAAPQQSAPPIAPVLPGVGPAPAAVPPADSAAPAADQTVPVAK